MRVRRGGIQASRREISEWYVRQVGNDRTPANIFFSFFSKFDEATCQDVPTFRRCQSDFPARH